MKKLSLSTLRRAAAPLFVLVAGGLLMAPAHAVTTNLTTNGGFETGDLSAWTANAPFGAYSVSVWNITPSEGTYHVVFNSGNMPGGGSISQTIPTVVGKTYVVQFDYGMGSGNYGVTDKLHVDFTGNARQTAAVTVLEGEQNKPIAYTPFSLSFVATSTSSTLTFTDDAGNYSWETDAALDNIRVFADVAPVTLNSMPVTNEDNAVSGNLLAYDDDMDPLTYSKVSDPANGTVVVNSDGTFTYTPDANFNGTDSFTFKANDGLVDSNSGTVNITVNAVNDAPVVSDQNVNLDEDNAKTITISATDVDGDDLFFNVVNGPTHGSLDKTSGTLVNGSLDVLYIPNANFNGTDSFQYTISDKNGSYFSGTGHYYEFVSSGHITWDEAKDAAASKNLNGQTGYLATVTSEGENTFIGARAQGASWLGGSDEGEEGTWRWKVGPEAGNIFRQNGETPSGAYAYWGEFEPSNGGGIENHLMTYQSVWNDIVGDDRYNYITGYVVEYGGLNGGPAALPTVNITVKPTNDAPLILPASLTATEDTPTSSSVSATDIDGDTLSYSKVSDPANGTVVVNSDGTFTYTPKANFNGPDSFTFKANDGTEDSNTVPVFIAVTPVNDKPVGADKRVSMGQDTSYNGNVSATDVDGDPLIYNLTSIPSNGGLSFSSSGNFTYTPNPGFVGVDSFTFTATDTSSEISAPKTVSITVKDTVKPGATISSPKLNQKVLVGAFIGDVISGEATDNKAVVGVKVRLSRKRGTANQYWNGTDFVANQVWLNATLKPVNIGSVQVNTLIGPEVAWTLAGQLPGEAKLDAGAYAVQVYAQDAAGNNSAYVNSSFSIVKDAVAPTLSINTPTMSQKVLIEDFTSNAVSGTTNDDVAVTAVKVRLSRKRGITNYYWNGTDFVTASSLVDGTINGTSWNLGAKTPAAEKLDAGAYQVEAYALDAANNKSVTSKVSFSLSSDFSAPSVAISTPTSSKVIKIGEFNAGIITGTAGDNKGITSVKLKLQRKRGTTYSYWNGTSFDSTAVTVEATFDSQSGTWSYDTAIAASALDAGSYTLYATAFDAAGNKTTSAARNFSIVGTPATGDAPVVSDAPAVSDKSAGSS